jgi:hypothetical protein
VTAPHAARAMHASPRPRDRFAEIDIAPSAVVFLIIAMIVMQLFANVFVLDTQRRIQERAQELLHIQTWQLEQLVPSSGSTST